MKIFSCCGAEVELNQGGLVRCPECGEWCGIIYKELPEREEVTKSTEFLVNRAKGLAKRMSSASLLINPKDVNWSKFWGNVHYWNQDYKNDLPNMSEELL